MKFSLHCRGKVALKFAKKKPNIRVANFEIWIFFDVFFVIDLPLPFALAWYDEK